LLNQAGPLARKNSAKKSSNVKQRPAAANQTDIVWAVADNIAICTQNSILQWDCVHNPSRLLKTQLRIFHHRTLTTELQQPSLIVPFFAPYLTSIEGSASSVGPRSERWLDGLYGGTSVDVLILRAPRDSAPGLKFASKPIQSRDFAPDSGWNAHSVPKCNWAWTCHGTLILIHGSSSRSNNKE